MGDLPTSPDFKSITRKIRTVRRRSTIASFSAIGSSTRKLSNTTPPKSKSTDYTAFSFTHPVVCFQYDF